MGKTIFTKQQLEAISSEHNLTVLNSSAGTGKTTVLTERILHLIEKEKFKIGEILVLTFTNNAAKEIRQRMREKLSSLIQNTKADNEKKLLFQEALNDLPTAYISTFHAFCKKILQENFTLLDKLSPTLNIVSDVEYKLISEEARNETISELKKDEDNWNEMHDLLHLETTDRFKSMERELLRVVKYLGEDLDSYIKESISFYRTNNKAEINYKKLNNEKPLFKGYIDIVANELQQEIVNSVSDKTAGKLYLQFLESIKDFNSNKRLVVSDLLKKISGKSIYKKDEAQKSWLEIKHKLTNPSSGMRAVIRSIAGVENLLEDHYVEEQRIEKAIREIKFIGEYVKIIEKKIREKMEDRQLLNYDDLIVNFLNLVRKNTKPNLLQVIERTFKEILIDEFQDTNPYQLEMVTLVKNTRIFIVGDIKQLIYRFQGANPKVFKNMVEEARTRKDGAIIDLQFNFRSNEKIINFVNTLFTEINSFSEALDFSYDDGDKLISGLNNRDNKDEESIFDARITSLLPEAEARIRYIFKEIVEIKKNNNEIMFNDFLILSSKNEDYLRIKALAKNYGVPITIRQNASGATSVFYVSFTSLLRCIEDPNKDISYITVLTNLFDISDNDLAKIKLLYQDDNNKKNPNITFFQLTKHYIDSKHSSKEDVLSKKLKSCLNFIYLMMNCYEQSSFESFIGLLIRETKLLSKLTLPNKEEESFEWLNLILSKAQGFLKGDENSLSKLIHILDGGSEVIDISEEISYSDEEDSVQVMTIHKAKGMEAKYVFYNDNGGSVSAQYEGVHHNYTDFENLVDKPSPIKAYFSWIEKTKKLDDSLRLFYVLCTRAKEKLYIVSMHKDSKFVSELVGEPISSISFIGISTIREVLSTLRRTKAWNLLVKPLAISLEEELSDSSYPVKPQIVNSSLNRNAKSFVPRIENKLGLHIEDLGMGKEKGSYIHKLFEIIINSEFDMKAVLDKHGKDLTLEDRSSIEQFFQSKMINKYRKENALFKPELSMTIKKSDLTETYIIDLLIVSQKEVVIIDYKTDVAPLEKIKENHTKQLKKYYSILKNKMYQNRQIKLYIYSVKNQEFIEIN